MAANNSSLIVQLSQAPNKDTARTGTLRLLASHFKRSTLLGGGGVPWDLQRTIIQR
ncbi:hypothetical protein NDU88_002398, partial [Pleurodeles waltl]